jgi:hypothetical protein
VITLVSIDPVTPPGGGFRELQYSIAVLMGTAAVVIGDVPETPPQCTSVWLYVTEPFSE